MIIPEHSIYAILLDRPQIDFGITGVALFWLRSVFSGLEQYVAVRTVHSSTSSCSFRVPILKHYLLKAFLFQYT